jgi:hypothetical protein
MTSQVSFYKGKFMKRRQLCATIASGLFGTASLFSANHQASQTTFIPRSISNDPLYTTALTNFRIPEEDARFGFMHSKKKNLFHMEPFYAHTTDGNKLARYFLIGGKTTLNVRLASGADIAAQWLGLADSTNFDSKFSIRPERVTYGAFFTGYITLNSLLHGLWTSVTAVPMYARHDLHFKEFDEQRGNTNATIKTISDALNQQEYRYGKFSLHPRSKVAVDDMVGKIGYTLVHRKRGTGTFYGCVLFPMGESPSGEYVFEPMIGTEHWGFGGGVQVDRRAKLPNHITIAFVGQGHYIYRLGATERRSFDLRRNGPWSRYLRVVREGEGTNHRAGINYFTRDMHIKPRSEGNMLLSAHLQRSEVNVEIGYEAWARSSEKAHLKQPWDANNERIGIHTFAQDSLTISTATIGTAAADTTADATFTRIQARDINLDSATHKATLSHKLFAAISTKLNIFCSRSMIGLAGSYEFSHANTAAQTWSMWTHLTIPF